MGGGYVGSSSVLLQEAVDVESSHRMESSCTASESPIQTSFTDESDNQVPTPVSDMNLKSGWVGVCAGASEEGERCLTDERSVWDQARSMWAAGGGEWNRGGVDQRRGAKHARAHPLHTHPATLPRIRDSPEEEC